MEVADSTGPQHEEPHETGSTTEAAVTDEEVDNGLLNPAVWASVHLWLETLSGLLATSPERSGYIRPPLGGTSGHGRKCSEA